MEITRTAAFLEYLERVHARTRNVALCVRPEDLEWRQVPDQFSCGDIIRHIATIERWMYAETVMGRPSAYNGHTDDLAGGLEATMAFYDRLHAESVSIFRSLTDSQLSEKCQTPAGIRITVGKWLRAMIEHEAHHRGQLYFILRQRGVPTPPLYGLTSEQVHNLSLPETS